MRTRAEAVVHEPASSRQHRAEEATVRQACCRIRTSHHDAGDPLVSISLAAWSSSRNVEAGIARAPAPCATQPQTLGGQRSKPRARRPPRRRRTQSPSFGTSSSSPTAPSTTRTHIWHEGDMTLNPRQRQPSSRQLHHRPTARIAAAHASASIHEMLLQDPARQRPEDRRRGRGRTSQTSNGGDARRHRTPNAR